jgi:hypothetical protein
MMQMLGVASEDEQLFFRALGISTGGLALAVSA